MPPETQPAQLARLTSPPLPALCAGYFGFYVITGVAVKYFQGPTSKGYPGLADGTFLVYSTAGGSGLCILICLALGWFKLGSGRRTEILGVSVPEEVRALVPSGLCAAVIIPATTLLYSLPISVMVAMVMMRGSIIIVSRLVDATLQWQGLRKGVVRWEENVAVVFALLALCIPLFESPTLQLNAAALAIFGSYVGAYAVRLYLMNLFKLQAARAPADADPAGRLPEGAPPIVEKKADSRFYFAGEQAVATVVMLCAAIAVAAGALTGAVGDAMRTAWLAPPPVWPQALAAGAAYGMVAFFSVFIFLQPGRSATFSGLVNRLTSLVAGTVATLCSHYWLGGRAPAGADWASLAVIGVSVSFLALGERRK
ncbi:MAG: hypothetical protein EXR69_14235 [Myxococcales bacterium]|nr:hypothetical protein [Myxococcales bacterium]